MLEIRKRETERKNKLTKGYPWDKTARWWWGLALCSSIEVSWGRKYDNPFDLIPMREIKSSVWWTMKLLDDCDMQRRNTSWLITFRLLPTHSIVPPNIALSLFSVRCSFPIPRVLLFPSFGAVQNPPRHDQWTWQPSRKISTHVARKNRVYGSSFDVRIGSIFMEEKACGDLRCNARTHAVRSVFTY